MKKLNKKNVVSSMSGNIPTIILIGNLNDKNTRHTCDLFCERYLKNGQIIKENLIDTNQDKMSIVHQCFVEQGIEKMDMLLVLDLMGKNTYFTIVVTESDEQNIDYKFHFTDCYSYNNSFFNEIVKLIEG